MQRRVQIIRWVSEWLCGGMVLLKEKVSEKKLRELGIAKKKALCNKTYSIEEVFDKKENKMKKTLGKLEKQIEKEFGKRCDSFEPTCHLCKVWKKFDSLREELLK